MSRKMLFFDIDGTLVAEGTHYLPQSAVNAIRKARENGHLVFINTGRTRFSIDDFLEEIGFDGYVCGCGTAIYVGEKTIFKNTLTKEYCREIIKMLRTCNITAVFEEENRVFFDEELPDHKILHDLRARFGTKAFDIPKSLEDGEILFDKFVVWAECMRLFQRGFRKRPVFRCLWIIMEFCWKIAMRLETARTIFRCFSLYQTVLRWGIA